MRRALAIVFGLAATTALASLQDAGGVNFGTESVATCVDSGCHGDYERFEAIAESFASGVHAERGMTCYDCHSISAEHLEDGDPHSDADRPPRPWEQPAYCGRCHSEALLMRSFNPAPDITAEEFFWTSRHGEAQAGIRSLAGDEVLDDEAAVDLARQVATCTSCHGAHGIQRVDNPFAPVFPRNVAATCGVCHGNIEAMGTYSRGLAEADPSLARSDEEIVLLAGALQDYAAEENVHRQALEDRGELDAPTCNDCHGNHAASPPGALGSTRVAAICGVCHVQSYTDFGASPKAEFFDDPEYRDCYACHSNHRIVGTSIEMVGLQDGSVCARCHADPDEGLEGGDTIVAIREEIDSLVAARDRAEAIIAEAERKGMDVGSGRERLAELNTALITARAKIHTFDIEPIREAAAPGHLLAYEAYNIGEEALSELTFRHIGLAASSLIILFFAALLFLKIRQIDRRNKGEK